MLHLQTVDKIEKTPVRFPLAFQSKDVPWEIWTRQSALRGLQYSKQPQKIRLIKILQPSVLEEVRDCLLISACLLAYFPKSEQMMKDVQEGPKQLPYVRAEPLAALKRRWRSSQSPRPPKTQDLP